MRNKEKTNSHHGSYKIPGGRTGVLLVHSLGGSPDELRYLAQSFGREGYTVNCPFIPGMTGGTDISGISTYEDWYAGLEDTFNEMAETCDDIYIGGLSAGAMLALRLAAHHPERIRGIMLFAPTLWPNGWAIPWYFNLFRVIRERFTARLFHFRQRAPYGIKDERIRKFVIERFTAEDRPVEDLFGRGGGLVYQFRRLVSDVKRKLGTIEKPALIMHPRYDDQSDLSNAFQLQRKLGTIEKPALIMHPRYDDQSDLSNAFQLQRKLSGMVESVILDDCYHMITLDRQRHVVVERAVEFVDRLAAVETARTVTPLAERQMAAGSVAGE